MTTSSIQYRKGAVEPVIASNEVPFLQMRSGSHKNSGTENERYDGVGSYFTTEKNTPIFLYHAGFVLVNQAENKSQDLKIIHII